jgi:hypothetical protein
MIGDWEIKTVPDFPGSSFLHVIVKNNNLECEFSAYSITGAKVFLFDFPETEYAKGPMLAIVSHGYAQIFFFNKLQERANSYFFSYGNIGEPRVGTEIYNGEPHITVAGSDYFDSSGSLRPNSPFFDFGLVNAINSRGSGPKPGFKHYQIESE